MRHPASGNAICDECIYLSTSVVEEFPSGTVRCFRYKHTDAFNLTTEKGKFMLGTVADSDPQNPPMLDAEDHLIYSVLSSECLIPQYPVVLKKINCCHCGSLVPNWFVKYNKYFQMYVKNITN